ncbi:UDP-N-acetylmuramoyl-tripeptide--D-alanyl-D-alanine ligase [Nevskia soli]|uniref:UDP-N-acetylmuramoyl-tripeptide--D-alanyl-D- alanine ligase n=1 Tax=Nevskia soli TaxID=418856 RepID=UPI001FE0926D|nr:UDP-N-acetylmuramoyl-tripeptide--D-alanyl-D-alanine ligase [Nevskia soli]
MSAATQSAGPMEHLSDLARRIGGSLLGEDAAFARVVTDTRQLRPGDLFVALKGERFDGHDYVLRAASLGATGSLVSQAVSGAPSQVLAADTLGALQAYARSWRADFTLPVIGVTGSSGKTTTKQMLAAVCAARGPVLSTEGNLNNHIGLPLTLLRLREGYRSAVIEMGASAGGEIALLADLARPDIGIVTQAGDAHLEGFGSREGVARGKGELFTALGGRGVAVINRDDAYFDLWRELAGGSTVLSFGLSPQANVRAENIHGEPEHAPTASVFTLITPQGRARVELPLPGRHNVLNALSAAAAGLALGLDVAAIAAGLAEVRPVAGRLNWLGTPQGARLLDDSYNANPTSLRAALDLLAGLPGNRWLVLGDMRELGGDEAAIHEEAGRTARALGIDRLYTVGALAQHAAAGFGAQAYHFPTAEALIEALRDELAAADAAKVSLLVKGSRSSRMERVVAALTGTTVAEAH